LNFALFVYNKSILKHAKLIYSLIDFLKIMIIKLGNEFMYYKFHIKTC